MKKIIQIEVSKIDVGERYYEFTYKITSKGKVLAKGIYGGDYENGDTPKQFKKYLEKDGWLLALEQL